LLREEIYYGWEGFLFELVRVSFAFADIEVTIQPS